jgi:hypothetical protein
MRPSIVSSMVLLSVCAVATPARATQCPAVSVFPRPNATRIPTNGHILLQQNLFGSDLFGVEDGDLWLQSADDTVPLDVVARASRFDTQIVVAPSRDLRPNTTYGLHAGPAWLQNLIGARTLGWVTGDRRDETAPIWTGTPKIVGCNTEDAVCPLSEITSTPVADDGEILLFAVDAWHPTEPNVGFFVPAGDPIGIGWGECFTHWLAEGKDYRLTLYAIDRGGNRTKAPASVVFNRTIVFKVPEGPRLTLAGKLALGVAAPFALGFAIVFLAMKLRSRRR